MRVSSGTASLNRNGDTKGEADSAALVRVMSNGIYVAALDQYDTLDISSVSPATGMKDGGVRFPY